MYSCEYAPGLWGFCIFVGVALILTKKVIIVEVEMTNVAGGGLYVEGLPDY